MNVLAAIATTRSAAIQRQRRWRGTVLWAAQRQTRLRTPAPAARRRCRAAAASGPLPGSGAKGAESRRRCPGDRRQVRLLHDHAASDVGYRSPSNARRPVSISYRTTPKAQMSARLSTVLAARLLRRHVRGRAEDHARSASCAGVVIVGDCDAFGDRRGRLPSAFARPKSSTFTVPSGRSLMFAGFRSRWMMPCSCAASSASAICLAIGSASSSGIAPSRDALREIVALDQFHHEGV